LIQLPVQVQEWLAGRGCGSVVSAQPVSGGCINHGQRLVTDSGQSFFLKTNPQAPPDMFAREAEGLAALSVAGGPRIPQPFLVGVDFFLLEDLQPGPRCGDYWTLLGRQLAALHRHSQDRFGFTHDNYLGSTPQPNAWTDDGHAFFGEQRLLYQARLAVDRGQLGAVEMRRVERLAARLPDLIPLQPASLIHGDLWSGNVLSGPSGEPALIDPAAHYGWAEAELAMTALFGGFPEEFYRAYAAASSLEPGWRGRFPVYNLYHLLNHLNLFGRGYWGDVVDILQAF
jgi:fructosamine-3-kinase